MADSDENTVDIPALRRKLERYCTKVKKNKTRLEQMSKEDAPETLNLWLLKEIYEQTEKIQEVYEKIHEDVIETEQDKAADEAAADKLYE